jgi:hypothetical protein
VQALDAVDGRLRQGVAHDSPIVGAALAPQERLLDQRPEHGARVARAQLEIGREP